MGAKDPKTLAFEIGSTCPVSCKLFIGAVRSAIDLDDDLALATGEIGEERPDRALPHELHFIEATSPQLVPQPILRRRCIGPEDAGTVGLPWLSAAHGAMLRVEAVAAVAAPHPNPLPVRTGRGNTGPALRLGLRQVDGLSEDEIAKMRRARGERTWTSIPDIAARAGVKTATLEKLAAADAFRSLGLDRRQALWQVKALSNAPALPLFDWSTTRADGTEADVQLPHMPLSEHVVNDYQTLRLSLKAHPMSFLRKEFRAARVISCNEVRTMKDGARVAVAGVILVRQRPGSAKGVVFMTIEDETGVANAVVWPKTLERYRKVVMTARLILIEGRIQRHEDIIHIVSTKLEDRSDWLLRLSEWAADMQVPVAHADEVKRPDPGSARGHAGDDQHAHPRFARPEKPNHPRANHPRPNHPRNVRIIPKSRDFH